MTRGDEGLSEGSDGSPFETKRSSYCEGHNTGRARAVLDVESLKRRLGAGARFGVHKHDGRQIHIDRCT
jgi:hypothetical protein